MKRTPKSQVRIDDSLARRAEQRLLIHETLTQALAQNPKPSVRDLARRCLVISSEAPAFLVDLSISSDESAATLALLVLGEIDASIAEPLIEKKQSFGTLSEEQLLRLLAAKTLLRNEPESVMRELEKHGDPIEILSQITGRFWSLLSPAEMTLFWVEKYASLPPEEKLPLLEMFTAVARRDFPAIARIEAGSGAIEVDRFIAEALQDFPEEHSLRALERLLLSADAETRVQAERSLHAIHQSHPDLPPPPDEDLFRVSSYYKAFVATDGQSDQQSVVLACRSAAGSIVFCIVLVDVHQGVIDLWGNAGFTDFEFEDLLETINANQKNGAGNAYKKVKPQKAIAILQEAEELSYSHKAALPTGFNLWRRLWNNA